MREFELFLLKAANLKSHVNTNNMVKLFSSTRERNVERIVERSAAEAFV